MTFTKMPSLALSCQIQKDRGREREREATAKYKLFPQETRKLHAHIENAQFQILAILQSQKWLLLLLQKILSSLGNNTYFLPGVITCPK